MIFRRSQQTVWKIKQIYCRLCTIGINYIPFTSQVNRGVAFHLCFKASPSVKPFIWKLVSFTCKWTKICVWTKLIPYERLHTRRGEIQVGNILLNLREYVRISYSVKFKNIKWERLKISHKCMCMAVWVHPPKPYCHNFVSYLWVFEMSAIMSLTCISEILSGWLISTENL